MLLLSTFNMYQFHFLNIISLLNLRHIISHDSHNKYQMDLTNFIMKHNNHDRKRIIAQCHSPWYKVKSIQFLCVTTLLILNSSIQPIYGQNNPQSSTNSQQISQVRPIKIINLTPEEQNTYNQFQNNSNLSSSFGNLTINHTALHTPVTQSQSHNLAAQLASSTIITQASTSATSPANGYKLMLKSYDTNQDVLYVDLVPIEGSNEHEPRIELRSQFQMGAKYPFVTVDERAPNDTFVAAILASDGDPGPRGEVDVSIESGNELHDFKLIKLVTASNLYSILVNGAPLSRSRCQEYNLNIVARDRGQPPKLSSLSLVIKINATQASSSSIWGIAQIDPWHSSNHTNEPATELMYLAAKLVILFVILVLLTMFIFALGYKR